MPRVQVNIPDDIYEQIVEEAKRDRRSVSNYVCIVLENTYSGGSPYNVKATSHAVVEQSVMDDVVDVPVETKRGTKFPVRRDPLDDLLDELKD